MASGYDGSIRISTKVDEKGFNDGMKGITASLGKVGAAIGLVFGVGQIVNFGKSAVTAASNLASAMTGLKSIMDGQGKSFSEAQKFINSYISDGLMPAANAIGAYKNLSMTGFTNTEIEQMLIRIKDAAAFGRNANLSLGDAVETATQGIRQENSILIDNSGITKNLSRMWKDYAASIGKSVNDLTDAEKRQAAFNGIMEETRFQMGDAGRLTETYAGKVGKITATWEKFKEGIGSGLITAISAFLPFLQQMLDSLVRGATAFSQLMQILFGMKVPVEDNAKGLQDQADAAGDLADNTKKAGKEAKGALAAFDELNVLQQKAPEVDAPTTETGTTENPVQDFVQTKGLLQTMWDDFKKNIETTWNDLWKSIQDGTIWQNVWTTITQLATLAWIGIQNVWNIVAPWFQKNVIEPVVNWFKGMWENIEDYADALWTSVKILAGLAWDWIKAQWGAAGAWFDTNVVKPVEQFFTALWEGIKFKAGETWESIKNAFAQAGAWFKATVTDPVSNWFSTAWENIKLAFDNAWKWMQGIWQGVGAWFTTNVSDPIKNAFQSVLDWLDGAWETAFQGVEGIVKSSVNTIIDFVNGMIRAIADGINAVLGGLNSLSVTIPDWVPGFGGSSWGVNLPMVSAPQIPRLATGAVIPPNSQFAAILGDQRSGTNIEAPADLIRSIVREEIAAAVGGGDFTVTMPVYLDSRVIYEGQQRVSRQRGPNLIQGATA